MSEFNIIYRALCDYRKVTQHDKQSKKNRGEVKKANKENEILEAIRYTCSINNDWINMIESHIEFIVNAIAEQRQFIRTDGEIVPIEKVKKVSKATVSHLAKHSNLITRLPEPGEDIIPEKLYIVEKNSDFAVYENRFLFMLLSYLRDFIDLRLEKIEKLLNKYNGKSNLDKVVVIGKRTIKMKMNLEEERNDNPYPIISDETRLQIAKIKDLAKTVETLLQNDLMVQVGKTPMIKPPVVKTNVLKMNNNFKNALELYEYVSNYDGEGFTFEEVKNTIEPFSEEVADDYSELVLLNSFLTFEYGNELKDTFIKEYEEEERLRLLEEQEKLKERIRGVKRRIKESGLSTEEYILMLEERNDFLEADSEELKRVKVYVKELEAKIADLKNNIVELNFEIEALHKVIEEKDNEIAALKQKYIDDMNALKLEHQKEIASINHKHQLEIDKMLEDFDEKINELEEEHEAKMNELINQHETEIHNLNESFEDKFTEFEDHFATITENYESQIENLNNKYLNKFKDMSNEHQEKVIELNDVIEQNELKIEELKQIIENVNKEKYKAINEAKEEITNKSKEAEALIYKRFKDADELVEKANNEAIKYADDVKIELLIMEDEKNRILAELHALKSKYNLLTDEDDFTSKERFKELEDEYIAFYRYFRNQWKTTKMKIRRELLWTAKKKDPKKLPKNNVTIEDINKLPEENVLPEAVDDNPVVEMSIEGGLIYDNSANVEEPIEEEENPQETNENPEASLNVENPQESNEEQNIEEANEENELVEVINEILNEEVEK